MPYIFKIDFGKITIHSKRWYDEGKLEIEIIPDSTQNTQFAENVFYFIFDNLPIMLDYTLQKPKKRLTRLSPAQLYESLCILNKFSFSILEGEKPIFYPYANYGHGRDYFYDGSDADAYFEEFDSTLYKGFFQFSIDMPLQGKIYPIKIILDTEHEIEIVQLEYHAPTFPDTFPEEYIMPSVDFHEELSRLKKQDELNDLDPDEDDIDEWLKENGNYTFSLGREKSLDTFLRRWSGTKDEAIEKVALYNSKKLLIKPEIIDYKDSEEEGIFFKSFPCKRASAETLRQILTDNSIAYTEEFISELPDLLTNS